MVSHTRKSEDNHIDWMVLKAIILMSLITALGYVFSDAQSLPGKVTAEEMRLLEGFEFGVPVALVYLLSAVLYRQLKRS